jgi:hypothetical protein
MVQTHDAVWQSMPSNTSTSLFAIGPGVGIHSQDLFIEGRAPSVSLVLRYDGKNWVSAQVPVTYCLTCKQPSRTVVDGVTFIAQAQGRVQRIDPVKNTSVVDDTGLQGDLLALWGADFQHVHVAGTDGAIASFDGAAWTPHAAPPVTFSSLWGADASEVYAVGDNGTILRFDGQAWKVESTDTSVKLNDVWGSGSDRFAVGEDGTILKRVH